VNPFASSSDQRRQTAASPYLLKIDLHLPDSGEPATAEFIALAAAGVRIRVFPVRPRGHGLRLKAALVTVSAARTGGGARRRLTPRLARPSDPGARCR
jgi:hypothetical protein